MEKKILSYDGREILYGVTTILLGSMGSIAETSELQLKAFNKAFNKFGTKASQLLNSINSTSEELSVSGAEASAAVTEMYSSLAR